LKGQGAIRAGQGDAMALARNRVAFRTRLAAVLVAALLAGCSATAGKLATPYDPSQSAYARAQGTGVISGQAFLQKPSGALVYAAGRYVLLLPASAYSLERLTKIYGDRKFRSVYLPVKDPEVDPLFVQDVRTTKASSSGRFEFTGLAPGKYVAETSLNYEWHDGLYGGRFYEFVEVGDGETVELVLTD